MAFKWANGRNVINLAEGCFVDSTLRLAWDNKISKGRKKKYNKSRLPHSITDKKIQTLVSIPQLWKWCEQTFAQQYCLDISSAE